MANKPADRSTEAKKTARKIDRMWLYVDGKRTIRVETSKAHEVAESYAKQGQSVWLTRLLVKE